MAHIYRCIGDRLTSLRHSTHIGAPDITRDLPGDLEVTGGRVLEVPDRVGELGLTQRVVDAVDHRKRLDRYDHNVCFMKSKIQQPKEIGEHQKLK